MSENRRIHLRIDTAANWATHNPILGAGEPGYVSDTGALKIGDGVSTFSALQFFTIPSSLVMAIANGGTGATTAAAARTALGILSMAIQAANAVNITGGTISLLDNQKVILGTGLDLEIFHDGSNSIIRDVGTGSLILDTATSIVLRKNSGGTENMAVFTPDGAVSLYYDGVKKFETTVSGVTVTGAVFSGAQKITAGWEPFNGTDGVFYSFGTNGTVAEITAPDFADGFEYLHVLERLSGSAISQPQVRIYRATTAAYGAWVSFYDNGNQAAGTLWSWDHEFPLPRVSRSQHVICDNTYNGTHATDTDGPGSLSVGATAFTHATAQKLLRAQFRFATGNINGGTALQFRRACIAT